MYSTYLSDIKIHSSSSNTLLRQTRCSSVIAEAHLFIQNKCKSGYAIVVSHVLLQIAVCRALDQNAPPDMYSCNDHQMICSKRDDELFETICFGISRFHCLEMSIETSLASGS